MWLLLLAACGPGPALVERVEPTFLEVTLVDERHGSAEEPLPFSGDADGDGENDPERWHITVRALDRDQALVDFNGDLTLSVRPGKVAQDPVIHVEGGEWEGDVAIQNGFGPTRIWVSDLGDEDADSGRPISYATGVTDAIWYAKPTIAELQRTADPETNALAGEYAELRVEDREVVVTAVTTNGFWVTDKLDEPGSGNSLFVYTFNKPDDIFAVGATVTKLDGIDQEYLATTQLYWPTIEAGDSATDPPEPTVLDGGTACDEVAMEGLESSRVDLLGWQIPDTFDETSDDFADFEAYGQWPIQLGSCVVYVESGGAAPDFYPPDYAGMTLPRVTGMVSQVFGSVVIVVVDAADLEYPATGPDTPSAARTHRAGRHLPPPSRKYGPAYWRGR